MRTLFLSLFILLSCHLHAADTSAPMSRITKKEAWSPTLPSAVSVINSLDYMRQPPYGYNWFGTQPSQAVSWLGEDTIVAGVHTGVTYYNAVTKESNTVLESWAKVCALASAQNRVIAGYGDIADVLDAFTGKSIAHYCHVGGVRSISVSDDAHIAAVGGYAYDSAKSEGVNTVVLYDLRTDKLIKTYQVANILTGVAVSPDGTKVAIGNKCQVDYGDVGSNLAVRTGSKDTNKEHALVQAVCFTQDGGLYSGDNGGLMVCPMDEETRYYDNASQYRRWISALSHRAGGIWVLANDPCESRTNQAPMVTRRKSGENTCFDLAGENLGACAANKAGDLALVGSQILLIKN